jgi:ABC-type taurine transport system substrate-binding protein
MIRVASTRPAISDGLPSVESETERRSEDFVVNMVRYARTELAIAALAKGDADIGHGPVPHYWAAAARGAPVRLVVAHTSNAYRLVSHAAILHCSALDGRDLAVQSAGAVSTAFLRAFLADQCPDVLPAYRYVPLSADRVAALLSGGVRATVLELPEVVRIDRLAPGRFRVLGNFAALWGDVVTCGVFVNVEWARQHPDLVRRYVRTRVLSYRTLVDAEVPGSPGTWEADGGLTRDIVERSLAFFVEYGGLPSSLDTASAADLSFLTDVLAALADENRRAS